MIFTSLLVLTLEDHNAHMLLLQLKRYPRTHSDMLTNIIVPIPLQVFVIIPFFHLAVAGHMHLTKIFRTFPYLEHNFNDRIRSDLHLNNFPGH